jgi:hypothetical protein
LEQTVACNGHIDVVVPWLPSPRETINQSQGLSAGNLRKEEETGQRGRNRTLSQETNRSKNTYSIILLTT